MSGDYKVSRCTRRCYALDRPLGEGEWYYSVVLESGDDYLRRDFSAEAWLGPPDGAVGWWKSRMPIAGERKKVLAPKEVLIDLLVQMADTPGKAKTRYLLALLLLRRRFVRPLAPHIPVEVERGNADAAVPGEPPPLRVEVIGTGATIEVPVCEISRGESAALRDELTEWIYCEAEG